MAKKRKFSEAREEAREKRGLTDKEHEAAETALQEERESASEYKREGKKAKNKKLKRTFGHARKDELEHAAMFRGNMKQRREMMKRV